MENHSATIESRLIVLEEKLEYQDYTIEKLNDVIIAQQIQVDKLEDELKRLHEKLEAGHLESEKSSDEQRPPHY